MAFACGKETRTALTTLKMEVFAPIPSARVKIATKVNPGVFQSCRKAKRRSFIEFVVVRHSFRSEHDHWIDARGSPGGQPGGSHRGEGENRTDAKKDSKISRLDLKKDAAQPMRDGDGAGDAEDQPDGEQLDAVRKNQVLDLETLRPEREADPDFPQVAATCRQ